MSLAIPKGKKVKKPTREPDMLSKRGVPYWFGPDWVRDLNGTICRIVPLIHRDDSVALYMLPKTGGQPSYIEGSIQKEFLKWHEDRQIDAILLGLDESSIIATSWEYE